MALVVDDRQIATDKDGHLCHADDWSAAIAEAIAVHENINLLSAHWEIIYLLRQFYQQYELSPPMRPLVKYVAMHLDADKGRSIHLMQLFPPSPARIASKIAGLPRPENCL